MFREANNIRAQSQGAEPRNSNQSENLNTATKTDDDTQLKTPIEDSSKNKNEVKEPNFQLTDTSMITTSQIQGNAALIDSKREGIFSNRLDEFANKLKPDTTALEEESKAPETNVNEVDPEQTNHINVQISSPIEENGEFKKFKAFNKKSSLNEERKIRPNKKVKVAKFKGKVQSLLEEMEVNIRMINKLIPDPPREDDPDAEKKEPEDSDEMIRIINDAMEEAEIKGIKKKYEILLLILKKENDFYKEHLKNLNKLISQYIDRCAQMKTKKKPTSNTKIIDLSKSKKMLNLVTKQITTAHKQIRHLSIERDRLYELMRKSDDIEYLNDLEQKLLDFNEAIKIQREKVNAKRRNEIKIMDKIFEKGPDII